MFGQCCGRADDGVSLDLGAVMAGLVPATHAEPPAMAFPSPLDRAA